MQKANAPASDRGAAVTSLAGDAPQHSKIDAKTLAAIDRASDLDRAWFARHPTRAYRLRPVVPGEFGRGTFPSGTQRLALVKQLLPGCRTRFAVLGDPPAVLLRHLPRRDLGCACAMHRRRQNQALLCGYRRNPDGNAADERTEPRHPQL